MIFLSFEISLDPLLSELFLTSNCFLSPEIFLGSTFLVSSAAFSAPFLSPLFRGGRLFSLLRSFSSAFNFSIFIADFGFAGGTPWKVDLDSASASFTAAFDLICLSNHFCAASILGFKNLFTSLVTASVRGLTMLLSPPDRIFSIVDEALFEMSLIAEEILSGRPMINAIPSVSAFPAFRSLSQSHPRIWLIALDWIPSAIVSLVFSDTSSAATSSAFLTTPFVPATTAFPATPFASNAFAAPATILAFPNFAKIFPIISSKNPSIFLRICSIQASATFFADDFTFLWGKSGFIKINTKRFCRIRNL